MIQIAALLLILYHVSPLNASCLIADHLEGCCQPFDTCASLKEDTDDHLWGNRHCECGTHCVRHKTCCIDSPHAAESWEAPHLEEKCQKLPTFQNAVIMVTKCSSRWRQGYFVREKCESLEVYAEDPVMATPVTSTASNVTYKNSFCALCNHENQNNLVIWNIRMELRRQKSTSSDTNPTKQEFLEKPVYDKERKSWGIVKDDVFLGLEMLHKLPPDLRKIVSKCYPDMISQCDSLQSHSYYMQFRCMSFYDPIKIGEVYHHNIYCAMCNSVNMSQVIGTDICQLKPRRAPKPSSFSFALLLDVGRKDGDLVGKKVLCQNNQKWDPFFQKCRSLVCVLPGRVVKDGKCVQN